MYCTEYKDMGTHTRTHCTQTHTHKQTCAGIPTHARTANLAHMHRLNTHTPTQTYHHTQSDCVLRSVMSPRVWHHGGVITAGRVSWSMRPRGTAPPLQPPSHLKLLHPQPHPAPAPSTASSGALRCNSGGSCRRSLKSIDALQQAQPPLLTHARTHTFQHS